MNDSVTRKTGWYKEKAREVLQVFNEWLSQCVFNLSNCMSRVEEFDGMSEGEAERKIRH